MSNNTAIFANAMYRYTSTMIGTFAMKKQLVGDSRSMKVGLYPQNVRQSSLNTFSEKQRLFDPSLLGHILSCPPEEIYSLDDDGELIRYHEMVVEAYPNLLKCYLFWMHKKTNAIQSVKDYLTTNICESQKDHPNGNFREHLSLALDLLPDDLSNQYFEDANNLDIRIEILKHVFSKIYVAAEWERKGLINWVEQKRMGSKAERAEQMSIENLMQFLDSAQITNSLQAPDASLRITDGEPLSTPNSRKRPPSSSSRGRASGQRQRLVCHTCQGFGHKANQCPSKQQNRNTYNRIGNHPRNYGNGNNNGSGGGSSGGGNATGNNNTSNGTNSSNNSNSNTRNANSDSSNKRGKGNRGRGGRGRGRGQTAAHEGCDVVMKDEEDCAVVVDKKDCDVVRKDEEEVSFFAKQILTDLEQQQRIKREQIQEIFQYMKLAGLATAKISFLGLPQPGLVEVGLDTCSSHNFMHRSAMDFIIQHGRHR